MSKDALRHALASLHQELGAADELDAESRAMLVDTLREIAEVLERDDAHESATTLGESIRSAVARFEGDHPDLVNAITRVAEALGAAGI